MQLMENSVVSILEKFTAPFATILRYNLHNFETLIILVPKMMIKLN